MKFDKDRFKFKELFINADTGKSSGSGFLSVIGGICGILAFVSCVVAYFLKLPFANELMGHIIIWMGIVTTLAGVRKVVGGKDTEKEKDVDGI